MKVKMRFTAPELSTVHELAEDPTLMTINVETCECVCRYGRVKLFDFVVININI